jgi:hypothetical protein
MPMRTYCAVLVAGVLAGCAVPPDPPPPASQEGNLTPQEAREALLRMMRSKPGQDLGWFAGDVPDEMAKMAIEEKDGGWYEWTAFRFKPSEAVYSLTVMPRPGAQACVFEYNGKFVKEGERWSASSPQLVRTGMQTGN